MNRLEEGARIGKAGTLAAQLSRVDVVVLDEFGYLPFARSGGQLLFHLVSKLYRRTSPIITTNLAFGEWLCHGTDDQCRRRAGDALEIQLNRLTYSVIRD